MKGVRTVDPGSVMERVRGLLGEGRAAVEGATVVAMPASDAEASALLRLAREASWRVLPAGAGVGRGIRSSGGGESSGPVPDDLDPDLVLSTLGMAQLLEHEPPDLTFRSRAGLTLRDLQEAVSGERQWLALDPPGGDGVTLGGIVATGIPGPLQVQYGRPRDQLLGLTLVDGEGRILSLGGRVVKNVAGFDLVRLAVGSRGSIGVVTEVTFRLYPRPEEDRTLVWSWEDLAEAWQVGRSLATLPLPLASAELIGGRWSAPLDDSGFRVAIRVTGSASAVKRMRGLFLEKAGHPLRELEQGESRAAARALSEGDGVGPVSFRAHTLPVRGRSLLGSIAALPLERLALHLLSGTFRGTLRAEAEGDALGGLGDPVRAAGGTLRVLRGLIRDLPGAPSRQIEVGQHLPASAGRLQSRIVRGFDPGGVLPGAWRDGVIAEEDELMGEGN